MAQHGKRYQELVKLVIHDKKYVPDEAIKLLKETAKANFRPDDRASFQARHRSTPRGSAGARFANLPAGTGKK